MSLRFQALLLASICAWVSGAKSQTTALPPEIEASINRAKLPRDAISIMVVDANAQPGRTPARLSHRASYNANPASVMKLVTTYAALDMLGPAYTWSTPVFVDGTVQGGTLKGNLYIKGQGDPKLVLERIWLLLRRVQALGIRQIDGNIVLDRSSFEVPDLDPASFDGEPLRPYKRCARCSTGEFQVYGVHLFTRPLTQRGQTSRLNLL